MYLGRDKKILRGIFLASSTHHHLKHPPLIGGIHSLQSTKRVSAPGTVIVTVIPTFSHSRILYSHKFRQFLRDQFPSCVTR